MSLYPGTSLGPYFQWRNGYQSTNTTSTVEPSFRPPSVLPPYSGAPPIPAGVAVNPQQWQAGFWQINPAYKHSGSSQSQQQQPRRSKVPWIVSPEWVYHRPEHHRQQSPETSAQAAQQISSSPNKRVYVPPSAEYLACKLSDNPLGLENMVPIYDEEYNRLKQATPWIWTPRALQEEDEGDRPSEESFTSKQKLQPTFSTNIVRVPEHYRTSSRETQRLGGLSTNNSNGINPIPLSRHSSMPSSSTSFTSLYSSQETQQRESTANALLTDNLLDEPNSMLSPLVMNKPLPVLQNGRRSLRNHPNPLLATQSLDTRPHDVSSYPDMRLVSSPPPAISQQQQRGDSYLSQQSSTGLPHLHTAPTGSPWIPIFVCPPSPTESSPFPRSPAQERLHEILESPLPQSIYPPSPPQILGPPPRNPDQERLREILESPDGEREPENQQMDPVYVSRDSPIDELPSHSLVYSRPSSRASSRSTSSNASSIKSLINATRTTYSPSPPPSHYFSDIPSQYNVSRTSDSPPSPVIVSPPVPVSPPAFYLRESKKPRRGFWNQRGDFLTADGYIVLAPDDKTYPADLIEYPREGIGYQDHNLKFTAYVPRPELPQSLSRHGDPPECPYEAICYFATHTSTLFGD